jgi:hypothetical protein
MDHKVNRLELIYHIMRRKKTFQKLEWKNKRNNVYNGCGRLRAFIQKKLMQFLLVLYWSTVHRLAYKTPPGTCVNVSAFGQATAAVEWCSSSHFRTRSPSPTRNRRDGSHYWFKIENTSVRIFIKCCLQTRVKKTSFTKGSQKKTLESGGSGTLSRTQLIKKPVWRKNEWDMKTKIPETILELLLY